MRCQLLGSSTKSKVCIPPPDSAEVMQCSPGACVHTLVMLYRLETLMHHHMLEILH